MSYIEKQRARAEKIRDHLIGAEDSPFTLTEPKGFYYEPFYQMMRQTLLGHLIARDPASGFDDFRHIHVIPQDNTELRTRQTSPAPPGRDITTAWKAVLREPARYRCIGPEELLGAATGCEGVRGVMGYLKGRCWGGEAGAGGLEQIEARTSLDVNASFARNMELIYY